MGSALDPGESRWQDAASLLSLALSIFVLFRFGAIFGDFRETWRHKVFGLLE
jgi:hypothetical protein